MQHQGRRGRRPGWPAASPLPAPSPHRRSRWPDCRPPRRACRWAPTQRRCR